MKVCSAQPSATTQGFALALCPGGISIPRSPSPPHSDLWPHITSQRGLSGRSSRREESHLQVGLFPLILSSEAAVPFSLTSLLSEITLLIYLNPRSPSVSQMPCANIKCVAARALPGLFTVVVLPPSTIPGTRWTINN